MNIHEAIKACLETGKSFENDYLSIEMSMGDLHLRSKRACISLNKKAQVDFEKDFVPSSWDILCILAKHKEFSASRKLADGSIIKLYFSKKGITLNGEFGDIYFPMKEDVYATDWKREEVVKEAKLLKPSILFSMYNVGTILYSRVDNREFRIVTKSLDSEDSEWNYSVGEIKEGDSLCILPKNYVESRLLDSFSLEKKVNNSGKSEPIKQLFPEHKVGDCLVLKVGGSPVFVSKVEKQKVSETLSERWVYTLLDEKGNTFDKIVDLHLDCVYARSYPPKYRVGEKFQSIIKEIWTIVRTCKDSTELGEKSGSWFYYLQIEGSKKEYGPIFEKEMQREYSKIEIPIEKPEPKYKVDEKIAYKGFQYTISKAVFCSEQKEWTYSLRSPSIAAANEEGVLERYIERLPEPKYKVGDTFRTKRGIVWTIKAVQTPCKLSPFVSYTIEGGGRICNVYEKGFEEEFEKVEVEPKPKYSAGASLKSKAGDIWTLISAEVRNSSNPDKRYIEYQIEYKNTVSWISESDLKAKFVHVPLPEEERQKYDLTWDQMISKLQEKQIAEFRNIHAGPNRNVFQRTCITKKDGQLILREGSKPYIPDLEATSSKWKLYDLPKKEPKYKIGDKLKECFRDGILKSSCFQIVDYRSGFEYDKIVWYYEIASWDEENVSTQGSLKGTSTYWFCEFSLDANWVKGLSITKKPKAKFKKDDIVTLVNYRETFKIKTVRWDSFLNMWCYTIIDTSGEKTSHFEGFLALRPKRPLEKKPFRNPLSDRPVSKGVYRGYPSDLTI